MNDLRVICTLDSIDSIKSLKRSPQHIFVENNMATSNIDLEDYLALIEDGQRNENDQLETVTQRNDNMISADAVKNIVGNLALQMENLTRQMEVAKTDALLMTTNGVITTTAKEETVTELVTVAENVFPIVPQFTIKNPTTSVDEFLPFECSRNTNTIKPDDSDEEGDDFLGFDNSNKIGERAKIVRDMCQKLKVRVGEKVSNDGGDDWMGLTDMKAEIIKFSSSNIRPIEFIRLQFQFLGGETSVSVRQWRELS
ncbi:hypothetical protein Avbf_10306 [Armadillidium vulgare]|nr:hypothetical protein Avbf_10306 [Armadillidium vulgare]